MPLQYGGLRPAVLVSFLLAAALASAAQLTLTPREVDEAILIGQSRILSERTRFHAPYRIVVSQPPVDYVEVITPFRRVALAADQRAQIGDRGFGQRQGLELLAAAAGQFDFNIELTFHPLNTYVGIPSYDVLLLRGAMRIAPVSLDRQPRYGARLEGLPPALPTPAAALIPGGTQPMLGGTVIARFNGSDLDANGSHELLIIESGKELARVRVDLSRLR